MNVYELVEKLPKTEERPCWDGWESVTSEELDKAFRENVPNFQLDADSAKALLLEAVGVTARDCRK